MQSQLHISTQHTTNSNWLLSSACTKATTGLSAESFVCQNPMTHLEQAGSLVVWLSRQLLRSTTTVLTASLPTSRHKPQLSTYRSSRFRSTE
jgi:hypothetical protein